MKLLPATVILAAALTVAPAAANAQSCPGSNAYAPTPYGAFGISGPGPLGGTPFGPLPAPGVPYVPPVLPVLNVTLTQSAGVVLSPSYIQTPAWVYIQALAQGQMAQAQATQVAVAQAYQQAYAAAATSAAYAASCAASST